MFGYHAYFSYFIFVSFLYFDEANLDDMSVNGK